MKSFIFNTRLPRKSEYDFLSETEQKAYIDRLKCDIIHLFQAQNIVITNNKKHDIVFFWWKKGSDSNTDFSDYSYFANYFVEYFIKFYIIQKKQINSILHKHIIDNLDVKTEQFYTNLFKHEFEADDIEINKYTILSEIQPQKEFLEIKFIPI